MPLSLPQKDVYFDQLLYPGEPIYNIGAKIAIDGFLDVEVLQNAYYLLISQHDAFRTTFQKKGELVETTVIENHTCSLAFVDFSHCIHADEVACNYIENEFIRPFEESNGGFLFRFILIKVSDKFHYLFTVYHHLITDGWGTSLMFQRLVNNYNEILTFGSVQTNYPFSYQQFIDDDAAYEASRDFDEDKAYWVSKFSSFPPPLFSKRKGFTTAKSFRKKLVIERETYDELNRLASELSSSAYHILLAVLYVYLGRRYENNDVVIGLPVLNRSKSHFKKTVGLFMGVSLLRMNIDFQNSIAELIVSIKRQLKADYRHQRFPLGKLVQVLKIHSEKNKLFNITFSYEKQDYSGHFRETKTSVIPLSHHAERVAMAIYVREFDAKQDVTIDFDFNVNYFDGEQAETMIAHFGNLLKSVLLDKGKKLSEISYLSKQEQQSVLSAFNMDFPVFQTAKTFVDIFKEQVGLHPQKVAVYDTEGAFTYLELDRMSSRIASVMIGEYLNESIAPIGILMDRSVTMIAVLLGILKARRPYIPLDPSFPLARLKYILQDSQTTLLIGDERLCKSLEVNCNIVNIATLLQSTEQGEKLNSCPVPTDTAYIIYTSGSTGDPKGVEVGHYSLMNFLLSMKHKPGIGENDLLYSLTTYSFDISLLEFFLPLISGATLFIANQQTLNDPFLLVRQIHDINPTIIQGTPSFFKMLCNAGWVGSKKLKVLVGGDVLSGRLVTDILTRSKEVWNMYGPTETTIWSSLKKITYAEQANNIGQPINYTYLYLLNNFMEPVPRNTPGEIYIGGSGLAKGYYKREQLTNERFITDPFHQNMLIYRTGDLGKWNDEGEVLFLGRNDSQVKIRGYRIELGDIEAQLIKQQHISDAVVVANVTAEDPVLVAYIRYQGEAPFNRTQLLHNLMEELPAYMVPGVIIPLSEFPLTLNKKIDRVALASREFDFQAINVDFSEPISNTEQKLFKLWQIVLDLPADISVDQNFFSIGGHSLIASRLVGLVRDELSVEISLKGIFDYPTIRSMAGYLDSKPLISKIAIPIVDDKEYYGLSPSQYRIWVACQQRNLSIAHNMAAAFLIHGKLNVSILANAVQKVIAENEILRTNFIWLNDHVFQMVNDVPVDFNIEMENVSAEHFSSAYEDFISREFDLQHGPLIRFKVIKSDNQTIMFFCIHHIIFDGLSIEIFFKTLTENYLLQSFLHQKNGSSLHRFQYRDYAEWINKKVANSLEQDNRFWTKYLEDYRGREIFLRDLKMKNSFKGKTYDFKLNEKLSKDLKGIANENAATVYHLLLAALNFLIFKLTNQSDICIGVLNSGRALPELQQQIGVFVKILILRSFINANSEFDHIIQHIKDDLFLMEDHLDIPDQILSKYPIDILFAYQDPGFTVNELDNGNPFRLIRLPMEKTWVKYPMIFTVSENKGLISFCLEYNISLFSGESIDFIAKSYISICKAICEDFKSLRHLNLFKSGNHPPVSLNF